MIYSGICGRSATKSHDL
ncbi:hypothetical protein Gotur_035254 [Gossypium turneri]